MKNCVVTVNYNDSYLTQLFATNIAKYSCVSFVVIVDNNSSDNSVVELKKINNDKIIVIESDKNGGYGYGNNLGFKYLKSILDLDFNVVFSNPDIEISEEDIANLFNKLSNDDIGIVGPVIKEGDSYNRGWKNPTVFKDVLLNIPFASKTVFKNILKYDESIYNDNYSVVDCVSGSIFAVSAKTFNQINMFDEGVFLYYEENIVSRKISKLNKKTIVANDINAIHHHSVSIDKSFTSFSKLKVLKESQLYYHCNYSNVNFISIKLLKFSVWLLLCIYKHRYGDDSNG